MSRPTPEDLLSGVVDLARPTEALRDELRQLVDHLPAAAVSVADGRAHLNRAAEALTGYSRSELPTVLAWFDRLYPGRSIETLRQYERSRDAGFPTPQVVSLTRKDGEERQVELIAFRDAFEVWLLRDVTDEARLARLMEQTARAAEVGGWEVDARTRKLYWTAETFRIHETTPEEYTPTVETAISFYAPPSIPVITEAVERGLEEGEPFDLELELITARGRRIWVRGVGVAGREDGRTVKLYGSFQDITPRRRFDEALRRSEEENRRLIAANPDGLLELDLAGTVLSVNPRGLQLLEAGHARQLVHQGWLRLWPAESRPELSVAVRRAVGGDDVQLQTPRVTRQGERRWCDVRLTPLLDAVGQPERLLVCVRDITAEKQAELEREEFQRNLLQTQKLESLGVLAGGIAHDFNNLLTGILGNAELVRLATPEGSPTLGCLEQIETAGERAADLCRQMLAYAGKGRFVVEPIDLNQIVHETVQLLRLSLASKKATLSLSTGRRLPPVLGDATQVRQVLMNLAINASEALGDNEGLITISTSCVEADGELLATVPSNASLAEGTYVVLEVTDTGQGMDEATMARIFEPFFTTKFVGRGLGLSAVQGIVRGHGGGMNVRSTPGSGSTFCLYFPAAPVPEAQASCPSPPRDDWRGEGVVLIVDDEEPVRHVAGALLQSFGFTVVEACDGREALRQLRLQDAVRLVLLDLTMPRLDGEQTLAELRELPLPPRVVLMSGYSQRELSERFAGQGVAGFLQKPFTGEQLRLRVREALADRA